MTGDELKRIRLEMKLSQEKFAQLIGARPMQVSKWETGRISMSRLYIEKVEKVREENGIQLS